MASEAPESVGRGLRQLFAGGSAVGLVDGQLLERLAAGRGAAAEAAFEAILNRHGPMVLATCRRVLGDHHAAEDAFQATFLVLVRRAGALRVRDSLGPWLHGVAARTALKARTGAARRQARERRVAVPEASGARDAGVDDLGAVLHAEVARLPAKYRAPVVLCYFEGRTHDEAAVTLGWPVGTVRGRLARARDLLRSRLARRGLAPAGLIGAMLTGRDARAEVSAPLRDATIGVAIRGEPVGAGVSVLTRHVLRSLLMAKVTMTGAMAVAGALLATGAVLVAQSVPAARRPARPDPAPAAAVRPEPARAPAVDRSGDPLPTNALARLGTVRFHNGDLVNQVVYTPDGKSLVTVGWDHAVRVWDAASGRILREIGDPEADLREIALPPDGSMLLTVEYPGLLRLWDFDSGRERRTALAWDLSDLRAGPPADPLDLAVIEARWAELAGDDARQAHRAAWSLSIEPAVPFLRDQLRPAAPPDPERIAGLIAALDGIRYATRAQAAAELERLGAAAAPALRRALAGRPSAEVRGQAERLLAALEGPVTSPEVLRGLRAIAALERVGTAEARAVLENLARGDPEARETGEARAALDRLGRRPGGR